MNSVGNGFKVGFMFVVGLARILTIIIRVTLSGNLNLSLGQF